MLPGLPQQNGNSLPSQVQNPNIHRSLLNIDHPDIVRARRLMQDKILGFIRQRQRQQLPHDPPSKKMIDLVKRLEEGLAETATTTEEYLNLATLESRLHILIRRVPMTNNTQQFSHANSSHPISTMIPTPGLPQTGNLSSIGASSVDSSLVASSNTITSPTVNPGSFNGTSGNLHRGSCNSSDGALASGYLQPSSAFSVNSGGNNLVTSMGIQRMTSQMIPTPGFNNSTNNDINNNTNNQSFVNVESSNNVGALQSVESTTVSQSMQQKQHVGGLVIEIYDRT